MKSRLQPTKEADIIFLHEIFFYSLFFHNRKLSGYQEDESGKSLIGNLHKFHTQYEYNFHSHNLQ